MNNTPSNRVALPHAALPSEFSVLAFIRSTLASRVPQSLGLGVRKCDVKSVVIDGRYGSLRSPSARL